MNADWWGEFLHAVVISPDGTRRSFVTRRDLLSHLNEIPEADLAKLKVTSGWREDAADYVRDVLAGNGGEQ